MFSYYTSGDLYNARLQFDSQNFSILKSWYLMMHKEFWAEILWVDVYFPL